MIFFAHGDWGQRESLSRRARWIEKRFYLQSSRVVQVVVAEWLVPCVDGGLESFDYGSSRSREDASRAGA